MAENNNVKQNVIDKTWMNAYDIGLKGKLNTIKSALQAQIDVLRSIQAQNGSVEGYIRVAGVSDPALSYKAYALQTEFGGNSWANVFWPCLVGTKLTGDVGQILYVLQKLDLYHDTEGNVRKIDGSEGDLQVCNIVSYYAISGKYTIDGTEFDVFLRGLSPFTWNGIEAEEVKPQGESPDYTVSHQDTDGVTRMHSVYNPSWNGSYSAPTGVAGKYVYSVDENTGEIVETYDANETLLGGAGGCHSTDLALYDGEQRAMNNNENTAATTPWMNKTAHAAELLWANLAAEGGTFDSHKAALFGSGFCANDAATAAADWDEDATGAKNGMRLVDKDGNYKYYSLGANLKAFTGNSSNLYPGNIVNSWRNPFKCLEAYRALCYAIQNNVTELTWFVFEGNKYKWRSIQGYAGPAQGEATAVVFKQMSAKMTSRFVDPTDKTTSLEGNRIDFLYAIGLYHGVTTQVSPLWWTSGLVFTEDESRNYEAYMQRDQSQLIKTPTGEISAESSLAFESAYDHVGSFTYGEGYRKNYSNDAFMLPDTNANKSGAGLHTYVCAYNYFTGGAAGEGKKLVRGFLRGAHAANTYLSPLCVYAYDAPSNPVTSFAFGTCCQIVASL